MCKEMKELQFSVLMSVYEKENPEHFRLALQSNLVDQTLLPDEMLLVCDGPLTPELDAVIAEYQEKCPEILRVHRLTENGGLGKALNAGLDQCHFDIIVRSDSDDVCASERFEKLIGYFEEHGEVDIVGSGMDEFADDPEQPLRKKPALTVHEDIVHMGKFRNPMNHATVAFKKQAVLKAGSYQPLTLVEDYYLWVRAICTGARLANLDEYLVHVRVGNGMVSRRGDRRQITSWRVLNRYMLEQGMITRLQYCRNMIAIRGFVYAPRGLKDFLYRKVLRK